MHGPAQPLRRRHTPRLVLGLLPLTLLACNAVFGVVAGERVPEGGGGASGATTTATGTSTSSAGGAGGGAGGGSSTTTSTGVGGQAPTCEGLGGVDASAFVRAWHMGGTYDDRATAVDLRPGGGVVVGGPYESTNMVLASDPLPYPEGDGGAPEGLDVFVAGYQQTGLFDWSVTFNGPGDQWLMDLAVDATDHVALTGRLQGSMTIGNSLLVADASRAADALDVFVARLDADGTPLWAKVLGGPDQDFAMSVATDANGDVIVAGATFGGTLPGGVDVDFGAGATHLDAWEHAIFLTKFAPNGAVLWGHVFPVDTDYSDVYDGGRGLDVAVDSHGRIVLAGGAQGATNSFGQGALPSFGDLDVFVYACDADGNYQFAKTFGDENRQVARAVAVDDCGDIFLAGDFTLSTVFSPLPPLVAPTAGVDPQSVQMFVARLDQGGDPTAAPVPVWSKGFWDDGTHAAISLALDGASNLLVSGHLADGPGSVGVDFGDGTPLLGVGKSSYDDYRNDLFVAKLRGDGTLRWATRKGGPEVEEAWAMAVAPDGRLVVAGDLDEPLDLGGGLLTPQDLGAYVLQLGP